MVTEEPVQGCFQAGTFVKSSQRTHTLVMIL